MQSTFNILLVEDDKERLEYWHDILKGANRKIHRASSGYGALRSLVKNNIHLMITDIDIPVKNGPEMNGFELIKRVREKPKYEYLYVIFTVDEAQTVEDVVQGLHDGASDFMQEPLNPEITKAKVAVFERLWRRRMEIREERRKTEELLRNILPQTTIEELKRTGSATARSYKSATILFTDFVAFTKIAEKTEPQLLLEKLNRYFTAFDYITEHFFLEKIKTIGDAYMAAGGIPIRNSFHAVFATLASFEIIRYMKTVQEEQVEHNEKPWGIRVGLHTGPLVAGVVGKMKYQYDVWGDTVNTAARLEGGGTPGLINVSGTTYELIKDYFDCTYRGKIEAKYKGEIEMYYVDRIKEPLSLDKEGTRPNHAFEQILSEN